MTSLEDLIFPVGSPRDGYILRLELVGTWESQFRGLGRLTAFLTPRLIGEAVAVDDMGVNVVFLQRHRVEVGLKLVLERAQAKLLGTHKIDALWKECSNACANAGFTTSWQTFAQAQQEFADLLNRVDPEGALFRYPVDKHNQPLQRGQVDLVELEKAGASFQLQLLALIRELASAEPLPVTSAEAEDAASELRSLIRGCRGWLETNDQIIEEMRRQQRKIAALTLNRR